MTIYVTHGIPDGWDLVKESFRMHNLNQRWWHDLETGERLDLDRGERLMLVVTELSEVAEAYRKDKMDDHLPQYKGEVVETCDALIRMLDLRTGYSYVFPYSPSECMLKATGRGNVLGALMEIVSKVENLHFLMMESPDEIEVHCLAIDQIIESLFYYAGWRGFLGQFREVYEGKVMYNQFRYDHSREGRLATGGKKI